MNNIRFKNELNEGGDLSISRNGTDYMIVDKPTVGSEKQIKWAHIIKGNMISCLYGWMEDPMYKKCENRLMAAVNKLNKFDDSKTLIDNRDMSRKEIVKWIEGVA